jgi:tRNA/tmRNA/rRNA uracil-C5-methylase (TrmA/RlmC/RlmD family)
VSASLVGSSVELDIGAVAHGGHCVARWDGRVVFVRHALPGERVRVEVTEGNEHSKFLRADAVEVLEAAPGRVDRPCAWAGPGRCGGCDWQHADAPTQRALLGAVVAEQMQRLAGIEVDVSVEAVGTSLLGWRTRMAWAVDRRGRAGLRRHRSHDVVPVDDCLIASPALPRVTDGTWQGEHVEAVVGSSGDQLLVLDGPPARGTVAPEVGIRGADGRSVRGRSAVREQVRDRSFRVTGAGFWQVHPEAATTLVDAVLAAADVQPGQQAWDLYAGVGLFTAFLAEAVGTEGMVVAVEADSRAVRDARRNLHDLPQARLAPGRVERVLREAADAGERADVVVLDPPRTGARAEVVRAVAELAVTRIVYVACDPAALARDVKTFAGLGWQLSGLRAFAMFPMTHHVECVAVLTRTHVG